MNTHTLLIRASAPFQSWGTLDDGRNDVRYSERVPTKSAIVGLLANAQGIYGRDAVAGALSELRMGVRVDYPGVIMRDFQVVGRYGEGLRYADGKVGGNITTKRYYLADADFLIGLEHTSLAFLTSLAEAVRRPVSPLFLGRKACVPGVPIWIPDGLKEQTTLETALVTYPWPRLGNEAVGPIRTRQLKAFYEVLNSELGDYTVFDSPMTSTLINPGERGDRFNKGMMGSRQIKEMNLKLSSTNGTGVPVRREDPDE